MYGVFISVVTKRSGQAIGLVIGTIILIETSKNFINFGPYIFTTYRGYSWGIFHQIAQGVDYQWFPEIWNMIIVSLIYCFATFAAGLIIFAKRDLNG
jgi:ABC-type transport system involved in multi-copper enzyme maturation permease subunit